MGFLQGSAQDNLEQLVEEGLDPEEYAAQWNSKVLIEINDLDSIGLLSTGFFSLEQVSEILSYRRSFGPLYSIYQMQQLGGFSTDYLQLLSGVIQFEEIMPGRTTRLVLRGELDLQEARGFADSEFMGSRWKRQIRFRSSVKQHSSLAFLTESDKGEGGNRWFDFTSAHYFRERNNWKAVLGDFNYMAGEGLLFFSGFGTGKNPLHLSMLKRGVHGIKPYAGSMETGFLRGAGIEISLNPSWKMGMFISRKLESATLHSSDSNTYFIGIKRSGLHRSINEQLSRKNIDRKIAGGSFLRSGDRGKLGLTWAIQHTDLPILKPDSMTEMFRSNGKWKRSFSVHGDYRVENLFLFSEAAVSNGTSYALVAGAMLNLHSSSYVTLLYRNYSPGFESILGRGFGEYSTTRNEKGLYLGICHFPHSDLKLSGYFDIYRDHWLRSFQVLPGGGFESGLYAEWEIPGDGNLSVRWKSEIKEVSDRKGRIGNWADRKIQRLQGKWQYPLDEHMEMRAYVSGSTYAEKNAYSKGLVSAVELISRFRTVSISGRACIFNVGDYNARIFLYERDLEYSFSIPSFQGEGYRYYILVKWALSPSITVWGRYSSTHYLDRDRIGSGWNEIRGSLKSQFKFQLRYSVNR